MAGIFGLIVQSSAAYLNPLFHTEGTPLGTAINRTLAASSPLQALNETTSIICAAQTAAKGCWDWTTQCSDGIGVDWPPFDYIRCTHMNFGMDAAPGTIFAPMKKPFDSRPHCRKMYGITPPTGDQLMSKYHFRKEDIQKTTRVIYSEAGFDPVRGFSVLPDWFAVTPDMNAPRFMYTAYASHTQDLVITLPNDTVDLINVSRFDARSSRL